MAGRPITGKNAEGLIYRVVYCLDWSHDVIAHVLRLSPATIAKCASGERLLNAKAYALLMKLTVPAMDRQELLKTMPATEPEAPEKTAITFQYFALKLKLLQVEEALRKYHESHKRHVEGAYVTQRQLDYMEAHLASTHRTKALKVKHLGHRAGMVKVTPMEALRMEAKQASLVAQIQVYERAMKGQENLQ